MLAVLIAWVFAAFCLFATGWLTLSWLQRGALDKVTRLPVFHVCAAGLIAITVFCNIWAYFAPVGFSANAVVVILLLVGVAYQRERISAYVRSQCQGVGGSSWPVLIAFGVIVAVSLAKSASPSELADEGAYYLPYIRWLEQFPIVPGIANIEDRLGFNSSFHMASAFFGLAWLFPGGAYDLNGLLIILFGAWCIRGLDRVLRRDEPLVASDVLKLFCLFFLMRNMITSPASDVSNIILGESIFILFLEKIEDGSVGRADLKWMLIVLFSVMVATIKLTSVTIWLVPAYLTLMCMRAPDRRQFIKAALATVIILVPWAARSPVLSGYLLYPVFQLDVLTVDWKVPKSVAETQFYYVSEFAKTDAPQTESVRLAAGRTVLEWVPVWFARENTMNKAMAVLVALSLIGLTVMLLKAKLLSTAHRDMLAFGGITAIGVLVWFFRTPAFRFGWAWCITLVAFTLYLAGRELGQARMLRTASVALLFIALGQAFTKTVIEARTSPIGAALFHQPPPEPRVQAAMLSDLEVRKSLVQACWGVTPPCLPSNSNPRLVARGATARQGFRIAEPSELSLASPSPTR